MFGFEEGLLLNINIWDLDFTVGPMYPQGIGSTISRGYLNFQIWRILYTIRKLVGQSPQGLICCISVGNPTDMWNLQYWVWESYCSLKDSWILILIVYFQNRSALCIISSCCGAIKMKFFLNIKMLPSLDCIKRLYLDMVIYWQFSWWFHLHNRTNFEYIWMKVSKVYPVKCWNLV